MKSIKNTKVFNDIFINIVATILPVLIMQFLVLPVVSRKYDELEYGLVLTLIGLITLSAQSFSVSLSNTRLLMNQEYIEKKESGDFNLLLLMSVLINTLIMFIGTYLYLGHIDILHILLIALISIIQLSRRYFLVSFRLSLEYKGILYSNLFLIIGYLVGTLIFISTNYWEIILIIGEGISLIYILYKTNLHKEPLRKTSIFKTTLKKDLILLGASFLGTLNNQLDRLLLFPLLGGNMVAVYYVSSLLGKTASIAAAPINNVFLSYLSKMKKFNNEKFKLILFVSSIFGVITYIFIIVISEPVLKLLYPTIANEAQNIIYITTLTAIIVMLSTVINPLVMKFCKLSWQIWINLINIIVFTTLSYFLVSQSGIIGFSIAALIAALLKFLLLIILFTQRERLIDKNLK